MSKILKFLLTLGNEVIPVWGNICPTWTIMVFTELKSDADLLAPEGVIMLPVAFLLDAIGLILTFVIIDDWGIMDFISTIIIGSWVLVRGNIKSELK